MDELRFGMTDPVILEQPVYDKTENLTYNNVPTDIEKFKWELSKKEWFIMCIALNKSNV